ncbi:hypothetical protein D5F01_LYC23638 [Larimichthys crocea]|uniref:Uncharacterized protein n=1 Tax=Larimichthys crocea TaxID=215358 RepID=A0A6G0HHK8_LARCR|nr:hypothetical protein D5F01_LYC23638 [Larimichthys crocea]
MRLHFRELTGVQLDDSFGESRATKFRRTLRCFQFGKTESSTTTNTILSQALAGGEETGAAVLMLVAHFKEQQEKMFINVDDTAIRTVDRGHHQTTMDTLHCGNSPLTAKMFMVAVDHVIVNEQLPCFNKALEMMFCSYYVHNIDYPVELAATLEFLQRVFLPHILNLDKHLKGKTAGGPGCSPGGSGPPLQEKAKGFAPATPIFLLLSGGAQTPPAAAAPANFLLLLGGGAHTPPAAAAAAAAAPEKVCQEEADFR